MSCFQDKNSTISSKIEVCSSIFKIKSLCHQREIISCEGNTHFLFFCLKPNMFCSIQQSFTLQICLLYIFSFKKIQKNVYADKKSIQEKGKKIMFNGSNCDRKSQLSGILTEPLNPLEHNVGFLLISNLQ